MHCFFKILFASFFSSEKNEEENKLTFIKYVDLYFINGEVSSLIIIYYVDEN